jgi:hypothetical protein
MRNLTVAAAFGLCVLTQSVAAQGRQLPESVNCERDPIRPGEVWERTEAHCLGLLPDIAARTGNTLRLTLDSGETRNFQNVKEGCDADPFVYERCFAFELEAYFQIGNSFVVHKGYMECGTYILIDRQTGGELNLDTMPIYSPQGSWFVSVNADDLCGRPYDVAIWSAASPPQPEFQYAQAKQAQQVKGVPYETWEFVAWDGEDRIKLRVFLWDGSNEQTFDTEAIRTVQGWQVKRPWATP